MSANPEEDLLQERQVRALERIALSLDSLVMWMEEIDKEGWGDRLEWYLSLVKDNYLPEKPKEEEDE